MPERKPIGRFMGVEFYADPRVPSGTVVFDGGSAITENEDGSFEIDFACGGTDTEQQGHPDGVALGSMEHPVGAPVPEDADISADAIETIEWDDGEEDQMAITRSIARGS